MLGLANTTLSLRQQCQLLQLNRSNIYYVPDTTKIANDAWLMNEIHEVWRNLSFYGYRKITHELRNKLTIAINYKRVRRLMGLMGIEAIYPKASKYKKAAKNEKYPYLLENLIIDRPNQVFATDITYIKLTSGFVYLLAIIDIFSRYIVSWQLSNTLSADFCIDTLQAALVIAKPEIINTDKGAQFTSAEWISLLQIQNILISMTGNGRCIDNVFIERLWRTIKYEHVYLMGYTKLTELLKGLKMFMEFYNNVRLHQALRYKTPASLYIGAK
jgi:putative transposase